MILAWAGPFKPYKRLVLQKNEFRFTNHALERTRVILIDWRISGFKEEKALVFFVSKDLSMIISCYKMWLDHIAYREW